MWPTTGLTMFAVLALGALRGVSYAVGCIMLSAIAL